MGWGTLVSITQKAIRNTIPKNRAPSTIGFGPPHGVVAVGFDAVGDAYHDEMSPRAKVMLPGQSIRAGRRLPTSRSLR